MKKLAAVIMAAFMLACMMSACAVPASSGTDVEHALTDAKVNYRSASLVVSGECVQAHQDANNIACCDIRIDDVIAGSAGKGDTIHCTSVSLTVGASYLLYLAKNGDVPHAEDSVSYSLVGGDPMELTGGEVNMGGVSVSFAAVRREMIKLNSVISSPAECLYYSDTSALVGAAEEIFIGRVDAMSVLNDTDFRKQDGGATVEYTIPASVARITAFGSVKGRFKYGDSVKLIYAPGMSADLVDAGTLTAAPYSETSAPRLNKGGVYMFFLVKGPDDKQDYYFCVNPMQGYAPIIDGAVRAPYVNKALLGYSSMDELVEGIQAAAQ